MKLIANRKNLKQYAAQLLGNEYSPEAESELITECINGFERTHGHISHDRAAHLERINAILRSCGVEGMLLDRHGNDLASQCTERGVALDIQYCNAGDTYAMTIMYVNGKLCLGDWGSLVERLAA